MRKYLFGTGIIGAVTSGMALLRGVRGEQFTWRTAIALLSWGLTLALAIGTMFEVRKESRDAEYVIPEASKEEAKLIKRIR